MALPEFLAPPPVLIERELAVPGLDAAHDGVRVAQLSDVHVGRLTPPDHVRSAVRLANEAKADFIVMTGDYVCWRKREIPAMERQLAGLEGPVFVTLGNHDYFTSGRGVTRALEANGYQVLRNQSVAPTVRGVPMHVIGIDDPVTRHHDLDAAFARTPDRGSRLALCHCPEQADGIIERGAQVVLSGHTHGGQVFVRGITDRIAQRMGRRYLGGLYQFERGALYVTPGVGFSGVRVRAGEGTRAEVCVFTLRAV